MSGAARSGNYDLKAARFSRRTQLSGQSGCTMSGDDPAFVRHAKLGKGLIRMTHRIPVGLAAHDDSHERRPGEMDRGSWADGHTRTCVLCCGFAVLPGFACSILCPHIYFLCLSLFAFVSSCPCVLMHLDPANTRLRRRTY